MMTLTTKELITSAKFIGGVRNSNLSNFQLTQSILNNLYIQLYQDIIDNSDNYIKFFEGPVSADKGLPLPSDCYQIEAVLYNDQQLERSARNHKITGCWRVVNNMLFVDGFDGQNVKIKYSTLPPTLTAPDDPVQLKNITIRNHDDTADLLPEEIYPYSDDELYFVYKEEYDDEEHLTNYIYNLETMEKEETSETYYFNYRWVVEDEQNGNKYFQIDFDAETQKITNHDTGEDITSWFSPYPNKTILNILTSYPHWIICYDDGTIYIDGVLWNQFADLGRLTIGYGVALRTNDKTGQYFIYSPDEYHLYKCSFVPDTIISYPDNTFHQLLEYKLAQFLAGQAGVSNTILEETLLPDAEKQFYKTLSKSGNVVRTNNIQRNII